MGLRATMRFIRDAKGIAAVEFALIVPVLALLTVFMSDIGMAAVGAMNMESAVRSSIQYAMNGGVDMTVAKQVGLNAWPEQPADASFETSKECKCGSDVVTCSQLCTDGSQPGNFVTAVATGTLGGSIIHFRKTTTQTVQVN